MRWSKLRVLIKDLFDPNLDLDVLCTAHRGENGLQIGRYWFKLDGQEIWSQPQNVSELIKAGKADKVASFITPILRQYLDTPKDKIFDLKIDADIWGVVEMLRACDRRIGKRRLEDLLKKTANPAARFVIERRLLL